MDWVKVQLKDICKYITDGKHGDCENQQNSGYYFISAKDVVGGRINYENARQITEEDFLDAHKRTRYDASDVIISNSGTLGRMAVARNEEFTKRTTFQKSVAILKPDQSIVDAFFLYYAIIGDLEQLISLGSGTAQKNLLLKDIRGFELRIPSLPIQRRIASILKAYDGLVENNLRRIKLLEDAAQCEYMIMMGESECVLAKLGHVATINEQTLSSKFEGTIRYIDIASVEVGHISDLQEYRFNEAPGRARRIVKHGDTIWSCVRPNRKSYAYITEPKENTIASTGFAVVTPRSIPSTFLHQSLITDDYVKYLESHATGSAYPAVTAKDFEASVINVPRDTRHIEEFDLKVSPYYTMINRLEAQNTLLRQARDILLPKLMNGEIDVSDQVHEAKVIHMPVPVSEVAEDEAIYETKQPKTGAKYYLRSVLAAYLVDALWQENTFGHVKLMKLMYLCEHLAGIETVSNYHRDAAGPYDNQMIRSIDKQLQEKKWFEMYKNQQGFPKYRPSEKRDDYKAEFIKYYSDRRAGIDNLLTIFGKLPTEKAEMVATIYEAWRDLGTKQPIVQEDEIVNEVLNNWHDNKKLISEDRWRKCYGWMVKQNWITNPIINQN